MTSFLHFLLESGTWSLWHAPSKLAHCKSLSWCCGLQRVPRGGWVGRIAEVCFARIAFFKDLRLSLALTTALMKDKKKRFIILPTYLGAKNLCLGISNFLPPEQTRYVSCYHTLRANVSVLRDYATTGSFPSTSFNLSISAWYVLKPLHNFS